MNPYNFLNGKVYFNGIWIKICKNMQNMQNPQNLQEECRKYASYHVILKMLDGSTVDGIIESVDNDRIIILVGEDVMEQENANQGENQRQPFGYGPRRRFRRFRRRGFPVNTLAALTLLQYPYAYPFLFF